MAAKRIHISNPGWTLTLCMRMMSPIRKILGWLSSFSQKTVQPIFLLDGSVIFRVEQKSVDRNRPVVRSLRDEHEDPRTTRI